MKPSDGGTPSICSYRRFSNVTRTRKELTSLQDDQFKSVVDNRFHWLQTGKACMDAGDMRIGHNTDS